MELKWEEGFMISTRVEGSAVVLTANREGLLSLANHLRQMAVETSIGAPCQATQVISVDSVAGNKSRDAVHVLLIVGRRHWNTLF